MTKKPINKAPTRAPDYSFWVTMAMWTLAEAIALALGLDPDLGLIDDRGNGSLEEPLEKQRRTLQRAFETGAFPNPTHVSPSDFLSWIKSNRLEAPKELLSAAKTQGHDIKDWRRECRRLEIELGAERANRPLHLGRRRPVPTDLSLRTIILGVAVSRYGYNPSAKRNAAIAGIVTDVRTADLSIDEGTVLNALRVATEELDYQPPNPIGNG